MGWGLSSLLPKNTILGKLVRGDVQGAGSSAVNYVKSGELLQDVKNVGKVVASPTSIDAWKSVGEKAVMGYKGSGNLVNEFLNKGSNITSLAPTNTQSQKAQEIQTSANIALAVGSGMPVSQAFKLAQPTSAPQMSAPPSNASKNDGSSAVGDSNTGYYLIGGLLIGGYLLLKNKKSRSYVRRTYSRASSAVRRTYSRRKPAMSYRKRRY